MGLSLRARNSSQKKTKQPKKNRVKARKINSEHKKAGIDYSENITRTGGLRSLAATEVPYGATMKLTSGQAATKLAEWILQTNNMLQNMACFKCGGYMNLSNRAKDCDVRCKDSNCDARIRKARLVHTPFYITGKRTSFGDAFDDKAHFFLRAAHCFVLKAAQDQLLHYVRESNEDNISQKMVDSWYFYFRTVTAHHKLETQKDIVFKGEQVDLDGGAAAVVGKKTKKGSKKGSKKAGLILSLV